MNLRHNKPLQERLAAEYVLGTLKGGARRRLEAWMQEDAGLRLLVAEWQDRLSPLAEFSPPVAPPPHVWRAVEQRLDAQEARRAFQPSAEAPGTRFWRWLGLASSAFAMVLLALMLLRQPDPVTTGPDYVAVLSDDKAQPALVVSADTEQRQLTVKIIVPQDIGADRSLELWALPKEGAPQSLGLIAANQPVNLALPQGLSPQAVAALAVSLEPKGGSPTPNAPTGPILFKGAWVQI